MLGLAALAGVVGWARPTATPAQPRSWRPDGPITVVVQYSAGGSTDITARLVARSAEAAAGVPVIVVNKPGGGGTIAHTEVANARPDGRTLLLANVPNMLTDKLLVRGVTYDRRSFRPLAMLAADPIVLMVRRDGDYDGTLARFAEVVRRKPGAVLFGTPGQWGINDFSRAIIEHALGVRFQRVPYGGGADAVKALLAGDVDAITTFYGDARPHIESGRLSVLAVADTGRLRFLPSVPTFREAGHNVVLTSWRVLVGPAGLSDAMADFLRQVFKAAMDSGETQAALEKAGINARFLGPAETERFLDQEHATYLDVIQRLGLSPR